MGHEEYESLIETLNILADSDTVTAIAEAEADLAEVPVHLLMIGHYAAAEPHRGRPQTCAARIAAALPMLRAHHRGDLSQPHRPDTHIQVGGSLRASISALEASSSSALARSTL